MGGARPVGRAVHGEDEVPPGTQSSQARAGLLMSEDDLLGDPARYAEAKGRASAPVESGSRGFKISDPRSIIPTDLTSFCGI